MGFELGPASARLTVEFAFRGIVGRATYNINDDVIVGDYAVPRRIKVESGGGPNPRLTMGIEIRGDSPKCTFLELAATDEAVVQAKHLKRVRVEEWVSRIVAACGAKKVAETSTGGRIYAHGGIPIKSETGEPQRQVKLDLDDVKAVGRMQRRRRDPRNDPTLLERVASIYRRNPQAPNKAIAAEFGVSERTAGRWAQYSSEANFLPEPEKQGKKRI